MKVVLRNPRRELELPAPRTVEQLLRHLDVVPESVLVIRNDTLVDARRAPRRRRHRRDPARSSPAAPDETGEPREVPPLPRAGGDRHPAPQRRVLSRLLPAPLPRAGAAHDRRLRHDRAGRDASSSRSRAARTRSASGTCSASSATRPTACTSASASASTRTRPGDFARDFADDARARAASRSTCPTDYGFDVPDGSRAAKRAPCSACGLSKRHIFNEAAIDARLRRARDRPQPRRRGRGAVRQRAALGRGVSRPPASGASRGARVRAQGEAARAAGRARARGVLRAHRHRLHRRGVPDGRGQPAPRVQGGAQRDRGALAGHQGVVPVRLPRARARAVRRRRGRGTRRSRRVPRSAARRRPATLRVLPAAAPERRARRSRDASRATERAA